MCINTNQYIIQHIQDKVKDWVQEVDKSVEVAKSEPQCAFTSFTQRPPNCHTHFIRTIPDIEDQLETLENTIRNKLIPVLLEGQQCNNEERNLLALPPTFGNHSIQSNRCSRNRVHEFKKVN